MRTASLILASYNRPNLLGLTLETIAAMEVPEGWRLEVVVAETLEGGSPQVRVDDCLHTIYPEDTSHSVGAQFHRAYQHSSGELILMCGDDDLQSPHRLVESVKAYEAGAVMMGHGHMRFVELDTGKVCRWDGPPHRAGGTMAYARSAIDDVGGWPDIPKNADHHLHEKLTAAGHPPSSVHVMPGRLGDTCAFLSHVTNISGPRPFTDKAHHYGSFDLSPLPHYTELDWPPLTAKALHALCDGNHPYP